MTTSRTDAGGSSAGPRPRTPSGAGSASRSAASRTRSSCAARAATSTTSSSRHAARRGRAQPARPRADRRRSAPRRAEPLPGVLAVVTGARRPSCATRCPTSAPTRPSTPGACSRSTRCATSARASRSSSPRTATSPRTRCDLIEVDYEPLPARGRPGSRRAEGAPLVHEKLGTNVAYERTFTFGEVDGTSPGPTASSRDRLRWPRSTGMPMDTNGAIADYDRGTGELTIYTNSMNFTSFLFMARGHAARSRPTSSTRARCPRAAASARSSSQQGAVIARLCCAMVAGRPVKYVEDRADHITNSDHRGSDRHYDVALAFERDGTLPRLRIVVRRRLRRLPAVRRRARTATRSRRSSGPYTIQHVEYRLAAVLTNKNQQGAYRGFGAEVSNWVIERLVDLAAQRARPRPRRDPPPQLDPAGPVPVPHPDRQHLRLRQLPGRARQGARAGRLRPLGGRAGERARAEGRHIGIGVVASQERSVFSSTEFWFWFDKPGSRLTSSPESARLQIDPTGGIVVTLHSQRVLGQQPRDRRLAARGRGVRRRPARRSSSPTPTRSTALPAPGPAARATP